MASIDDVASAIQARDSARIQQIFFAPTAPPTLAGGYEGECELWDFKESLPSINDREGWADVSKHVLAFHNNSGGALFFGIRERPFGICYVSERMDAKVFNDKIRRFVGDQTLWVDFRRLFIQANQSYVGLALIPKRGPWMARFKSNAPIPASGKAAFSAGDVAYRQGDESRVYRGAAAEMFLASIRVPSTTREWYVNESLFRIPNPDYKEFTVRGELCSALERALYDDRTYVTSLNGIGGVGKTALATWAAIEAYEKQEFEYIVSVTAKDRELTGSGITPTEPTVKTFESLLDSVIQVLGFDELRTVPTDKQADAIKDLLRNTNGLLFVDNLETVDDARIIEFLETLPKGPRVLTTSRRQRIRRSVYPIDVGPFEAAEAHAFFRSFVGEHNFSELSGLKEGEIADIVGACDFLPLVIKWFVGRYRTGESALREARVWAEQGINSDELLEFSFRRMYESLEPLQQEILQVVSLFPSTTAFEAVVIATGARPDQVTDGIDALIELALLERRYDNDLNDYSYTMLPITRAFVYSEVGKHRGLERRFRDRLTKWYEARDIVDPKQRTIIARAREGKGGVDALVELALQARHEADVLGAEELFLQALARDPRHWRACREYAELCRHDLDRPAEALLYYERAAQNVPRRHRSYALVYREWGMLLRNSGLSTGSLDAIEKFQVALAADPTDFVCRHALADMYRRRGNYRKVIEVGLPLLDVPVRNTRMMAYPLILEAYERLNELLKYEEVKSRQEREGLVGPSS